MSVSADMKKISISYALENICWWKVVWARTLSHVMPFRKEWNKSNLVFKQYSLVSNWWPHQSKQRSKLLKLLTFIYLNCAQELMAKTAESWLIPLNLATYLLANLNVNLLILLLKALHWRYFLLVTRHFYFKCYIRS